MKTLKKKKTNNVFKNILGFTLLASITLTSCSKNDDHDNPIIIETPLPDGEALQQAFISNREEALQSGIIDATAGGSLVGEDGTEFVFYPNGFLYENGDPVTGNVDIEFIETYKKADMLLMNMPTNGKRENGDIETLISGGEFFVNATKDGENLKPNGAFMIIAPSADNTFDGDMALFNGKDNDCDGNVGCLGKDGEIVWEEDQQNGLEPMDREGPNGQISVGYGAFVNQFGWTNIDKWYSDPRPKTTIYVDVPEGYDNTNSAVYISYDGEPTALGNMDVWVEETELFTEHYGLIPIGLEVHFILLSQVDGEWNYAIHSATIEENHVECFCDPNEVQDITEEALAVLINGLP